MIFASLLFSIKNPAHSAQFHHHFSPFCVSDELQFAKFLFALSGSCWCNSEKLHFPLLHSGRLWVSECGCDCECVLSFGRGRQFLVCHALFSTFSSEADSWSWCVAMNAVPFRRLAPVKAKGFLIVAAQGKIYYVVKSMLSNIPIFISLDKESCR